MLCGTRMPQQFKILSVGIEAKYLLNLHHVNLVFALVTFQKYFQAGCFKTARKSRPLFRLFIARPLFVLTSSSFS